MITLILVMEEERVVLHQWPFVRWVLVHCQDEQTLYSHRPRKRTGVSIYLFMEEFETNRLLCRSFWILNIVNDVSIFRWNAGHTIAIPVFFNLKCLYMHWFNVISTGCRAINIGNVCHATYFDCLEMICIICKPSC